MNAIDSRPLAAPAGRGDHAEDAADGAWHASAFTQIWGIVRKRKWILIGAVVAALLVGLILTLLATPLYTARTIIEIRRETPTLSSVQDATQGRGQTNDQEFYQTQYGLLVAQSLGDRVATDLRLADGPGFLRTTSPKLADRWFDGNRLRPTAPPRAERIRTIGELLLNGITITPDRNSRLVKISYTSPDPALSQRVANAWSTGFIQATLDSRFEATSYARNFLEKRLAQLRSRIDETERQLVGYASQQGIVNIPGAKSAADGTTAETPLVATDLAALNAELAKATADRITAQSRVGKGGDGSAESLADSTIGALRARRTELAADYARLMQQFEPGYGPAVALQNQIRTIDRELAREQGRVGGSLQGNYQASLARESELKQRVDSLKSSFLDLRRRTIQYDILQRDVDTNRQLYAALLQRYKEIGVAGGVGVNNISVVDPAELPSGPSSPRLLLNLGAALLLGLALGGIIAFLLEQVDTGISDPGEVPQLLRVPLLGTVPISTDENVQQSLLDPKTAVSEAYFSLQTTLRLSTDHGFPRSVLVTSSRPGEGKSTTSYALARSLAQLGRRVLLVDADMRSPSIHHLTGLVNDRGLSNYLSGENDIALLIQSAGDLFVMAAGLQPPSAGELLASDRLDQLIRELGASFDYVVLDAPPVMGIADAPLIGSRVEGAVFVVEAHATSKGTARVALARLHASHVPVFGVVLTKFNLKRAHYGYGYDYGYGYSYGNAEPSTSPAH